MLIVCPNCATSYAIDPASLGADGRVVRCSRCQTMWFAAPQRPVIQIPDSAGPPPEGPSHGPPSEPSLPAEPAQSDLAQSASDLAEPQDSIAVPPAQISDAAQPLVEAPPLVPPIGHAPLTGDAQSEAEDTEGFAARRRRLQQRRRQRRSASRWTAVLLILLAANIALLAMRTEIVRYVPQTASLFAAIGLPVNLRSLNLENMRLSRQTLNGVPILIVEGTIESVASRPVQVPRLRLAARNAAGQEIYSWLLQPERKELEPGGVLSFRSELASPPSETHDVVVRFFSTSEALHGQ